MTMEMAVIGIISLAVTGFIMSVICHRMGRDIP